jgi:hypothetical protein
MLILMIILQSQAVRRQAVRRQAVRRQAVHRQAVHHHGSPQLHFSEEEDEVVVVFRLRHELLLKVDILTVVEVECACEDVVAEVVTEITLNKTLVPTLTSTTTPLTKV